MVKEQISIPNISNFAFSKRRTAVQLTIIGLLSSFSFYLLSGIASVCSSTFSILLQLSCFLGGFFGCSSYCSFDSLGDLLSGLCCFESEGGYCSYGEAAPGEERAQVRIDRVGGTEARKQ